MAVAAAAEAVLVAAAEAAATAEGMSTGGGAGGCALWGMHMKRRARGLGSNCQEATDPAAFVLIEYPAGANRKRTQQGPCLILYSLY